MDAHYTPVRSEGEGAHYRIFRTKHDLAEDALRKMFPEGEANEMNFVLFSTSGMHVVARQSKMLMPLLLMRLKTKVQMSLS